MNLSREEIMRRQREQWAREQKEQERVYGFIVEAGRKHGMDSDETERLKMELDKVGARDQKKRGAMIAILKAMDTAVESKVEEAPKPEKNKADVKDGGVGGSGGQNEEGDPSQDQLDLPDGTKITKGEIAERALKETDLTVEQWNELPEDEMVKRLNVTYDALCAEIADNSSDKGSENPDQGGADDKDSDANPDQDGANDNDGGTELEKPLSKMTKDEIEEYAKAKFDVDLDKRKSKADLVEYVKALAQQQA